MHFQASIDNMEKNNLNLKAELKEAAEKFAVYGTI
jgi:hypothetical protein